MRVCEGIWERRFEGLKVGGCARAHGGICEAGLADVGLLWSGFVMVEEGLARGDERLFGGGRSREGEGRGFEGDLGGRR